MADGTNVGALYATLHLDKKKFAVDLAAVGIVAGTALLAVGGAALKMGGDYDAALDSIRISTGKTGAELDGLEQSFVNVSRRVPEDMGTVAQAIADLSVRTGQTGQGLEDLAANILDFSRLTGTDVSTNVRNATRLFGDWSIKTEDQAGTLDKVFRAAQKTGIGVDQLMEAVVTSGAPMRLLGFSFEESAALLGKWEKEGVNTGTMLSGLKFGVKTLAREGVAAADMGQALKDKLEAIGKSADPVGLAIKTFGLRAGPDMAAAILEGRFAVDDLVDSMVNGTDSINAAAEDTKGFQEVFGQIINTVTTAVGQTLLPLLNDWAKWFVDNMPAIQAAMETVGSVISGVVTTLAGLFGGLTSAADGAFGPLANDILPALQGAFQALVDNVAPVLQAWLDGLTQNVLPSLSAGFQFLSDTVIPAVAGALGWVAENILPPISAAMTAIAENVMPILASAFDTVVAVVRDNWPTISSIAESVGGVIKGVVEVISAVIKAVAPVIRWLAETIFPILGAAAGILLGAIDVAFKAIRVIFDALLAAGKVVVDGLSAAFNGLVAVFKFVGDSIAGVFKGAMNFLIGIANGIISLLNGIQIHIGRIGLDTPAGFIGVGPFDWNGLQIPHLRYLASGTEFFPGGLAMLGERGPELAFLPRGTGVANASETMDMLRGGGVQKHYHLTVQGNLEAKDEGGVLKALRRLDDLGEPE